MDLWSDDPAERVAAAQYASLTGTVPRRRSEPPPADPWPFGMPTSINPYVVFLGPSPGNSPPVDDSIGAKIEPYDAPTVGRPHPGIYCRDTRNYWGNVRDLGRRVICASASSSLDDYHADTLIGHLNLGTTRSGQAANAQLQREYLLWVPSLILNDLRPVFVIMLGLSTILRKGDSGFAPDVLPRIDWSQPDHCVPFTAWTQSRYNFSIWTRTRPDGQPIHFVAWPQHPGRAPMTDPKMWRASADEFATLIDFLRHSRSLK